MGKSERIQNELLVKNGVMKKFTFNLYFFLTEHQSTGYLYAVLNINNMIPVPDHCLTQLKYNQVESFRSFSNEKEKTDYDVVS